MNKEEIAERWPEAVALARELRAVFGEGVRLLYAKNERGEELGRPSERSGCPQSADSSRHR